MSTRVFSVGVLSVFVFASSSFAASDRLFDRGIAAGFQPAALIAVAQAEVSNSAKQAMGNGPAWQTHSGSAWQQLRHCSFNRYAMTAVQLPSTGHTPPNTVVVVVVGAMLSFNAGVHSIAGLNFSTVRVPN